MSDAPSHQRHREAAGEGGVRCAVLTISDTRTPETDRSGAYLREALAAAGHVVTAYQLARDEPAEIRPLLEGLVARDDVDAVLVTGGTGIARRDRTYDVVAALLDKTLPGFGELFRVVSFEQVGAAAMLSRAVAGVAGDTLLFSMPGSENAVRTAMERLILPELAHLVWELRR
ncbi:MAG: MogA/MoaB family molybdenum cofactor biosynthesis protein [Armatimonadetes bacterium]|nr:MogA/MoaB family molybdenum cofactor biosynthesis protein [Armatimonadota bacterium]